MSQAAAASQKYTIPELTDIGSFVDHLTPLVAGQTQLLEQACGTQGRGDRSCFQDRQQGPQRCRRSERAGRQRIHRHQYRAAQRRSRPTFSTQTGSRSLAAYHAAYNGLAWEAFLSAYVNGGAGHDGYHRPGDGTQLETYLVWDNNAIAAGADVDFWVLEPDGNLYIPALGSVSPNGTFSSDSRDAGVNFEGYLTNRYVQVGEYKIYANLWTDPQDFRPQYDLAYRTDQTADFQLLYAPNFPSSRG